ncbi:hypothetical protein [Cerasicoccus arenae]|uniref:hypothetical protein n=1 Tax=Cerasicoccus arenae TaxID=424488 RepID=UPI00167824F8|nr:hypothetical protein [Cerasicoccus arenae]MBK1860084.1 hypothetical protein [Cerasicoccus arenae]
MKNQIRETNKAAITGDKVAASTTAKNFAKTIAVDVAVVAATQGILSAPPGGEDSGDEQENPGGPTARDQAEENESNDPNGPTTTETRERQEPGGDGGKSSFSEERDENGDMVSTTHTVKDEDGETIHQHQDHHGRHGSRRRFPDELTGTETVGDPPVEDHPPTRYIPPNENHETADP